MARVMSPKSTSAPPSLPLGALNVTQTKTGRLEIAAAVRKGACPVWWRRLGIAGFIFFLVKGLLWLALPVFLYFSGRG